MQTEVREAYGETGSQQDHGSRCRQRSKHTGAHTLPVAGEAYVSLGHQMCAEPSRDGRGSGVLTAHGAHLPPLLVVITGSCSDSGPMVRLADVTVGCKVRPGMGWMTTLAGTVLSWV